MYTVQHAVLLESGEGGEFFDSFMTEQYNILKYSTQASTVAFLASTKSSVVQQAHIPSCLCSLVKIELDI